MAFAVHMGDLIDGYAGNRSEATLDEIMSDFRDFEGSPAAGQEKKVVYHLVGNHDQYHLGREALNKRFNFPSRRPNPPASCASDPLPSCTAAGGDHDDNLAYYELSPHDNFRCIFLDTYDISIHGWTPGSARYRAAHQILSERNPNQEWNSPEGLHGYETRFVAYNGAIGEKQKLWLERTLQDAQRSTQTALVFCHVPLLPDPLDPSCLLWNYDEILGILHKYPCVAAVFSGHKHQGSYSVDPAGVHHRTLEASLECQPGTDAFAIVEVYPDCLQVKGWGKVTTFQRMDFHSRTNQEKEM